MNDFYYSVWSRRQFAGGLIAEVVPLTFHRARIIVHRGDGGVDDSW